MIAGFMIAMGAIVYLTVGGVAGALLFAVGLMAVVHFKLNLFTGKAGLLATGEISVLNLIKIWFSNAVGTLIAHLLITSTGRGEAIAETSSAIIQTRISNGIVVNFVLGIFCGILMYLAVKMYQDTGNIVAVYIPVAVFILSGYNHCVADMFYTWSWGWHSWESVGQLFFVSLIPTTFGNIVGCNIIPAGKRFLPKTVI